MTMTSAIAATAAALLAASTVALEAAPVRVGDVYQEYVSDTCSFGSCFVKFAVTKKKLKIENASCYISHASAADLVLNRVAIGDMAKNGNLNSFASASLLAPITKMNEINNQTTYQFNVPVLVGVNSARMPAIFVEFTRDTASFLKCSIAGKEF